MFPILAPRQEPTATVGPAEIWRHTDEHGCVMPSDERDDGPPVKTTLEV